MEADGATVVRLREELAWRAFDIPGGNMPVYTVPLRVDPVSRARTLAVRFPAGWNRPEAGSYEASEEFVVLDGVLRMSGAVYRPGDWVYVPAGVLREQTSAGPEAIALARFFGPARWRSGVGGDVGGSATSLFDLAAPPEPSPLGSGIARMVLRRDGVTSWTTDPPPVRAPAPCDAEILALDDWVWAWVPQGAPFPLLEGGCFCRTFAEGGEP